jgi:hypothetical protein
VLPAAYHTSSSAAAQSDDPLGLNKREGRVEGAFDDQRHEGDTYYATSSYPDTTPDQAKPDAGAAAAAGSSAAHPRGPADVSSMNDPSGKGEEPAGNEHVHYPGRPDAAPRESGASAAQDNIKAQPRPRTSVETFPGTTKIEEGMAPRSGVTGSRGFSSSSINSVTRTFETLTRKFRLSILPNSSSSSVAGDDVVFGNGVVANARKFASGRGEQEGLSQGSYAGEGAGGDSRGSLRSQPGSPESAEIPLPGHSWGSEPDSKTNPESADATMDVVEGGTGSPISGSWRAMTADFSAGGDDMTGGGAAGTVEDDAGMKVNTDSGLPQLQEVDDAGAQSAGFGAQRDPQASAEEGYTARQTENSTGQVPADAGSS